MKFNMEQRKIVQLEPTGHLMVKGVAGSGKTTVAVKRVSFLHDHYCHEAGDHILLVTYNKTLLNYIRHQYENMRNEEDESSLLFNSNTEVKITTIDSLMFTYFNQYQKRTGKKYRILSGQEEHQPMIQAIHLTKDAHPDSQILTPKNSVFLLDEVNWILACNIPDLETYQQIDRVGRASGGKDTPQKLIKNSPTRTAIYALMETYHDLLEQNGTMTFKKMNLLALQEAEQQNQGPYTHIIIDESQDLTKVQLAFIKCIYKEKPYSSIMFVADNTQSIYAHAWLGKGRPYTTIGYDMSGKSRMLTKNYRTTTEISAAAYGLIEHDETISNNVDFVKPSLIDRHGHPPMYRFFQDSRSQLDFLIDEIRQLTGDYRRADICLVAKENRSIESAKEGLESAGIPCEILNTANPDFHSDKVKMVTMHSIKGLEFKVIFLLDLNEGVIPNNRLFAYDDEETVDSEERKLLYVGMTRANELLYMSSVRKPSKFIRELNRDHLRIMRDAKLRPFRSIGMQDYKLTGQIIDSHAKEEVIRQWLIKELHETYGYPLELITLEFPVRKFSQTGYVDLAVHIHVNDEPMPYLFAEVKRFGSGIDQAIAQLTSYMEADPDVRYGIATDGIDLQIINRDKEVMNDLPKCLPQFLPETKKAQTYLNVKNGKTYRYTNETDDPEHIEISHDENGLYMDVQSKTNVPVIGNVAAGIPVTVQEDYSSRVTLPDDWLIAGRDTFALIVTGDSMINAGIDKGDLVIVNRQESAANGDIVIALIDDEATMKKFMLMGDSVLLLAENPAYEAIQMRSEDIRINGKVIGVLKQQ